MHKSNFFKKQKSIRKPNSVSLLPSAIYEVPCSSLLLKKLKGIFLNALKDLMEMLIQSNHHISHPVNNLEAFNLGL